MKNKKVFWFFVLLSVIAALSGWVSIFRTLYTDAKFFWSVPLVCFFIALAVLGVYILVETQRKRLITIIVVAALPSLLMSGRYWYFMAPVWLLSVLLILFGIDKIKQEQKNRIKIIPHSLVRFGLPLITTAMSLLICSNFFLSIKDKADSASVPKLHVLMPKGVISSGLHLASAIAPQPALKSISQGQTVDEFIKGNLKDSLSIEDSDVESYLQLQGTALTPAERQQLETQLQSYANIDEALAIVQARGNLSKQLGQELGGQEKMEDVVVTYVNNRIDNFFNGQGKSKDALPLGMALALFLTIKTLAVLLSYPLAWTTTGVFRIIVKMGGIEIKTQPKDVEEIA